MATRFISVVTSERMHTQYIVAINDSEYSDVAAICTMRNASITYEGQGNERVQRILGTSANVELIIDTLELETLLEDIAGAPEGRFTVGIFVVTVFPLGNLKFTGYVLPDLISIPDTSYKQNYSIQLKATDGISRLKTIPYNDDGDPYEGYNTILEHVFNCLNKLPAITGAYGSSDNFLKVIFNWYENSRTYSASENTLTKVRCNHVAFYTIDSKGNYNYKSCYEVLEEICKTFFCRMFFADGTFWIVSLDEMRLSGLNAKTVFIYNKNQGESSDTIDFRILNDNSDLDNTDLVRLEGGEYNFFAALKKTAVRYSHRSTVNMLAGKVISNNGGGPVTYQTVDAYGGTGKLYLTSTLSWGISAAPGVVFPVIFEFNFTIQVGSYYLVTDANGNNVRWENSSGTYRRTYAVFGIGSASPITFSIPPTPDLIADGDLTFNVSLRVLQIDGVTVESGVTAFWLFENPYLELLSIGAFSGQADIKEYSALNDDTDNSAMLEADTILGDGPGLTSPGHLMILGDDNLTWSLTDEWRRADTGTYKTISQLLANKLIEQQLAPIKKFIGTFQNWSDSYDAWQVIDLLGTYWVFNGGTFNLKRDRVSGEWWNFPYTPGSTYTEGPPIDRPSGASSGGGSGSSSPSGSGGTGSGTSAPTRFLILEFENVTNSITISNTLFQWDYNGTLVFWNGRPLKQSDYSFNEPDIDWNFTIKGTTNFVAVVSPIQ